MHTQYRAAERRLAAAGLSDDAQRRAFLDAKGHIVNGVKLSGMRFEVFFQVVHTQQFTHFHFPPSQNTSQSGPVQLP